MNIGLIVGVQKSSPLWTRLVAIATDFASGFMAGLMTDTDSSSSRPREIGSKSVSRELGAVAGELIGGVAVGAVRTVSCLAQLIGLFFYLMFTVIAFIVSPLLGVAMVVIFIYIIAKRKSQT
jgi:hypothetical protein